MEKGAVMNLLFIKSRIAALCLCAATLLLSACARYSDEFAPDLNKEIYIGKSLRPNPKVNIPDLSYIESDEFCDTYTYSIAPKVILRYSYAKNEWSLPLSQEVRYPQIYFKSEELFEMFQKSDEEVREINRAFENVANALVEFPDYGEAYWTYSITRADEYYISVLFSGYERSSPNGYYKSYATTINVRTGEVVDLSDGT
ncbi:MAG: hypothetical protein LBN30_00920 [Oscillospiraceae bacterium]|jgi:hypothetical protein|nr:hypothetical protein [Oscillospiraceae bacterium]